MPEINQSDAIARRFSIESLADRALVEEAFAVLPIQANDTASVKFYGGEDGEPRRVVMVTTGGRKVTYPPDDATRFVVRDLELEREDLAIRSTIDTHQNLVRELEDRRERIAHERHRLGLEHKAPGA